MLYALCPMRDLVWIGPPFLWMTPVNSVDATPKYCAVFAILTLFLLFQEAEGFAGEVWAIYVLRIANIAKFIVLNLIQG
jgi:hypothetical protein